MGVIIPRLPLETIPPELRGMMDHSQPHVVLFNLAIDCGTGDALAEISLRNAAYLEWKNDHPEFDDSCPF